MKFKFIILVFALLFTSLTSIEAADRARAKIVLSKTNRAIGVAQMTVKRTKKYTGKLGKAVKEARIARKYYIEGNYDKSIHHSLYARRLATEVIKENNAKIGSDNINSTDENAFVATSPSDEELIRETNATNPVELKDEDLMNGNLEVEVQ
jgi:hypothetical protein